MSLATDLTACQQRLQEAGQKASEEMRKLKPVAAPTIYAELQLQLCNVASEVNKLKVLLGTLRMIGELEQRPPEVTAERLELAQCVPVVPAFPRHPIRDESEAFRLELQHIGDDTLSDEQNVLLEEERRA